MANITSIVLELQHMATDNKVRITDLLQKAFVVASKLDLEDFKLWILKELEGYPDKKGVPQYRVVSSVIKAYNPFHGWVHCQFEDQKISEKLSNITFAQPIGELEALVLSNKDKNGMLEVTFTQEVTNTLMKMANSDLPPTRFINKAKIFGILDTIRTTVLKWALKLEETEQNDKKQGHFPTPTKIAQKVSNSGVNYKAIILAAGLSLRWKASIEKNKTDQYYQTLFWENINRVIEKHNNTNPPTGTLGKIQKGPVKKNLKWHKSCAWFKKKQIMDYALESFKACNINDWLFVITANSDENAQEEQIEEYIEKAKNYYEFATIAKEPVFDRFEHSYSLYLGLKEVYHNQKHAGDIIVSYSDIVWEHRLLKQLLSEQGDIIVLVDTDWATYNYPPQRIWHDKFYAELIFYDAAGNIKKIGEANNRFEFKDKDKSIGYPGRQDEFGDIFKPCHGRIGEIVGLFKFSRKGAEAYLEEYQSILGKLGSSIEVAPWALPNHLKDEGITPKNGGIPIGKALVGDFLEHLSKKGETIKLSKIQCGWAEIDHWGDIELAKVKNLDLSRADGGSKKIEKKTIESESTNFEKQKDTLEVKRESVETEQGGLQEIIEVLKNLQKSKKTGNDFEAAESALPPVAKTYDILCMSKGQCGAKTTDIISQLGFAANHGQGYYSALLENFANPEVIADLEKWQEKSAEKADKQDKATTTSQSDRIVGDTWTILGIPINIKKLCTKLKSRPFLLCCCLLLIFIIVTYPLWHPLINKTDRDSSVNYNPNESKVSGILETQTKRISVPNPSLQKSVGTCEVIDIVKLFVEDVQGWAGWDTGAQPGTPIAWITEGKYDDPPKDMGSTFGAFARNGAVVLTIKNKPIYRQLKQTVVPGIWDIWLVGPNGGVLVVKMESEYGRDLPFDISKVLKKSGFEVTLYKGLEVRNTTGNFIIYHIESPGGWKAWLAESWSIGTAGGAQEIWITYEQKYADILWEKEGSLGKQHLLWKRESNKVSRSKTTQPAENKLRVTLKEICNDIDSRPLVQRSDTAKQYVGIRIKEERLKLLDVSKNPEGDIYFLSMVFPDQSDTSYSTGRRILCDIPKEQYPELNLAKQVELYISGQIKEAGAKYIELSDVSLRFE